MKNIRKISITTVMVMALVFGFNNPTTVGAATTPSLGTAGTYSVLSETFTRNVGLTTIVGDLGYTTLSGSGTHTVSGSTFIVPPAQAGIDQAAALSDLNLQACTFTFASGAINLATDTTHGPIGVYTPGVYCTDGAASIGTGGITLSGSGTFIFKIGGAFTSVDNSNVTLADSASSCNVFWAPTAATTLGANTTFKGIVIDDSGITVGNTTSWIGRALAFNGTITMDTDTITSTCTTAVPAPTPAYSSSGGIGGTWAPLPLINVTKIPTPLNLPGVAGLVTYNYTVTNIGVVPMIGVWAVDNKCSPVVYVSGDINNNQILGLTEVWKYSCTKSVSSTETNIVTAHGQANGWDGYDTAEATVVVGASTVAPLIDLVKVPSVFTLPVGGGAVTYRYSVTNPGIVPLSNVTITDNKCTGLPGRVVGHPGDINQNNLLEHGETWTFTCLTNLTQTTTNIGTAEGKANGLTVIDFAQATVVVATPGLPNTGFASNEKSNSFIISIIIGLLGISTLVYFSSKKSIV